MAQFAHLQSRIRAERASPAEPPFSSCYTDRRIHVAIIPKIVARPNSDEVIARVERGGVEPAFGIVIALDVVCDDVIEGGLTGGTGLAAGGIDEGHRSRTRHAV